MALHIASYNIHAGVGSDGRFEPRRLATMLRQLRADVIGLQEVVSVGPDGFALLDELAQSCDMEAIAGPTMMRGDASYGNALLTRIPCLTIRRLELAASRYEPRGVLAAEMELDGQHITVAVTHLGLRAGERRTQIAQLMEWLPPSPAPVVLLGDLNEWWPWSSNLRRLQQRFFTGRAIATFPARIPLLALDRILIGGSGITATRYKCTSPLSRHTSDHRPLLATIELT